MNDPIADIKKEDLMKTIEGSKLEEYKALEDSMSIQQCKVSRATMNGFLQKKKLSIGRAYKKSKKPEGQAKYKQWQEDVEKMEKEVIRWDLTIDKKKEEQKMEAKRK